MTVDLNYKGYFGIVSYDEDDAILFGRISGIRDGVGFHAETTDGLQAVFRDAVDDYLETCAKIGKQPRDRP